MTRLGVRILATAALAAVVVAPAAAQTFTLNGGLAVSGNTTLSGTFTATGSSFTIPTQSSTPSIPAPRGSCCSALAGPTATARAAGSFSAG